MFKNIIYFIFFFLFYPLSGISQENSIHKLFPEIESSFSDKKNTQVGKKRSLLRQINMLQMQERVY